MADTIQYRVTHIKIAGSQIDFCTQRHGAVFKLSLFHTCKQVQTFFNRSVTVWADSRSCQISTIFTYLFRSTLTDIRQTFFNQIHCNFIHFRKIVRRIIKTVSPRKAKPSDILFDCIYILNVFFCWIGIIHTQVTQTVIFFSSCKVNVQCFGMANVQIAVGFGRKTSVYLFSFKSASRRHIFFYKIMNKVAPNLLCFVYIF